MVAVMVVQRINRNEEQEKSFAHSLWDWKAAFVVYVIGRVSMRALELRKAWCRY